MLPNTKDMANLRRSAAEEIEDTLNVFHCSTGYEPKLLAFDELNDSSVPFSLMIPSPDQDVDDVTLGKLLTEAHRGQADSCGPGCMSVSQSSSSVMFDGSRQPDGARMVDRSGQPDVTLNVIEAHNNLSEDTRIEQTHDRSGNLMSETARKHRLGLYLKSKDRQLSQNIAKKSVITNSKQLTQKKSADSYKDNYGDRNWNFVKLVNKVLQRWRNYGKKFQSFTFDTIARRKLIEDQNTILELSGRVQELQNVVNCMNAETVRSRNSHVTSRPVSFPPHPIPEGMLRHSFVSPSRREGPPTIWDTLGFSGNVFLQIQMRHLEFQYRRAAPFVHSGKE